VAGSSAQDSLSRTVRCGPGGLAVDVRCRANGMEQEAHKSPAGGSSPHSAMSRQAGCQGALKCCTLS
jgi:hypothetical protein